MAQPRSNNSHERPKNLRLVLLRIWKYLAAYKSMLSAAILIALASNLFALVGPTLSGYAINSIEPGVGRVDFRSVFFYCGLMFLFYLLSSALSYVLATIMIKLSQRVIYQLRKDVQGKLLALRAGYFDTHQAGDIVSHISYDIDTIATSLSNDLIQVSASAITVVGSLAMMLILSPPLVLVFAVSIPISLLFTRYVARKVHPLYRRRSQKLGALNGYVEEIVSGHKTIKAYNRELAFTERFDAKNGEAVEAYYQAEYHNSIMGPSVNFVNNLSLTLISVFGAIMYMRGIIRLGDLSSFVLYSRKFSGPINEMANIVNEIQSACAAAERVFAILDELPEPPDAPGAVEAAGAAALAGEAAGAGEATGAAGAGGMAAAGVTGAAAYTSAGALGAAANAGATGAAKAMGAATATAGEAAGATGATASAGAGGMAAAGATGGSEAVIAAASAGGAQPVIAAAWTTGGGLVEMRGVGFGYTPDKKIIRSLDLTAPPGSLIAIVGQTGAGKTTIVNLLMRFYDPDSGAISLDGRNIMALTRESLRRSFALVLQDTWLFHGTVAENIAYGNKRATEGQIVAAAKAAKIHSFITQLPLGYRTVLSEDGLNISQGQKQLIAIARAMLIDARILILDEATSNVDTHTEFLIQEAMRRLMSGKTCFVIAHRLSTIRNADRILVVSGGDVVESGTHGELLQGKGVYAAMYASQFE
ncbi:MAG: ABC transporter ATP-binding protein/permease [Clostridiales bacterium]|jgi:ABC-type multidrug transport system fused ATPase/permease subunit|nr:ABC transporter ATP-binding protein/permease [Clostridiales bacterium]